MSILNALKTSAVFAGFATVLFAGAAEAFTFSTAAPNDPVTEIEAEFGGSLDLIGFTETTGNFENFITFDAEAGDTVSFDFNFSTGEGTTVDNIYRDGGFYTLNGEAFLLATSVDADPLTFETGTQMVSFDIATAGEYTLGFGAFNATGLTLVDGLPLSIYDNEASELFISNVDIDSDVTDVPEPASMLGLMAVAALGSSSVLKRKQS